MWHLLQYTLQTVEAIGEPDLDIETHPYLRPYFERTGISDNSYISGRIHYVLLLVAVLNQFQ